MSITPTVCAFAAVGTQHAMCMRHIVNCGLPRPAKVFHIFSQMALFSKVGTEHKMFVASFSTTFV